MRFMGSKLRKRHMVGVALAMCGAYLMGFTAYGAFATAQPSNVCVVFGNRVHPDGTPSAWLQARLEKMLDLYERDYCGTVIVSGGVGVEGHDEAKVMKAFLVERGVDDESVVVDSDGVNTTATARFVRAFCDEHGAQSVIGVSQGYHLLRVGIALRSAGVYNVTVEAPRYFEFRAVYSTLREAVAIPVYLLKGYR